ncbi:MAG: pyridoxamine 5'-phosphate oxidase family protein [Anaerolineae bacterium]|jgi:general stress protein 26|nr:pyridoxamine 5'-phosphate oxidase family protein [Anaerolineae bacterium]MBT7069398.1 pyridoxamine 5'-phosphate oxidase family protein [Anaerolineae bacterium]MBT7325362.1 pyridoxamine 5'-phosphate oxidase family protein [Anaerolineae bacterium]
MAIKLTTEQVWQTLEKELFAVLGMVTAKGEARTVGIVYIAHDKKLYIASNKETWKVRHIAANPNVSITVTIPKRIPLMPFIKIPAATITFSGKARVLDAVDVSDAVKKLLLRGLDPQSEEIANMAIMEIEPVGNFITYGVGVSLMTMRTPENARGRVPVA